MTATGWRSPLFLAGLAARLALMPLFASWYLTDLFIPFVDSGVIDPLSNPWARWPAHHFPYGSALYAALLVPKWLAWQVFGSAALGTGAGSLFLMRLPLLGFDLLLFRCLVRLAPGRERDVTILYWLNPVLVYITYVHGQLDVASMALAIAGLSALLRRRIVLSAVALALAALCKFHVVLLLPLAAAYLWRRDFLRAAARDLAVWALAWGAVVAAGLLPVFLVGRAAYVTAGSPEALRVLGAYVPLGDDARLFLGMTILVLVLGRLVLASRITDRGLLSGAAVLMGTLLVVVDPMPGWYYWVFPLFALFFADRLTAPRVLFWGAAVAYFARFELAERLPATLAGPGTGIALALLQASIAGIVLLIWAMAVRRESPMERRVQPLVIGVAGDSGAGKTTLATVLRDLFDRDRVTVLAGDDYHRWERGNAAWRDLTPLDPAANDLRDLDAESAHLRSGRAIERAAYDHGTGRFSGPREIRPGQVVIVEGLHALFRRSMRERLDLRVFLDTDEALRQAWRARRDVSERGHPPDRVEAERDRRAGDSQEYISPQLRHADWVVAYQGDAGTGEAATPSSVRHVVWNDVDAEGIAAVLARSGECEAELHAVPGDIDRVAMTVTGRPSAATIAAAAAALHPNLRALTRGRRPPRWRDGLDGVAQLVALAFLEAAGDLPGREAR